MNAGGNRAAKYRRSRQEGAGGQTAPAPSPAEIGEYCFSLLWGSTLLRLLLGLIKLPTGPEMEQRAKRAAERVIVAYGRSSGS